jgi:electron transfer flavoprotein beta subunit
MRIVVLLKAVPDLVEEIELTADRCGIDREYLKFVVNEWDAQALEEALLIKDADGAEIVAVGLAQDPEIDEILFTALAKGADTALKLVDASQETTPEQSAVGGAARAGLFAAYLAAEPADLVITGVQSSDDIDGQLPPRLAAMLGLPHVSVVVSLTAQDGSLAVRQEFAGGASHELLVRAPAVIGIQSARQSPRYAPISRIRQAMAAGEIAELAVSPQLAGPAPVLRGLKLPEVANRAEMLSGDAGQVAEQIVGLLRARGLVKE